MTIRPKSSITEIWKPIPGFDGYEVSDLGRVRSYRIRGSHKLSNTPHVLKSGIYNGYHAVNLGKGQLKRVHCLVLLTFIGPRPEGIKALHEDDNKDNNRLDNLYYGTSSDNTQDMIRNHNGIHPRRKHTVKKAPIFIKRDDFIEAYNSSDSPKEVVEKLGLKLKTVYEHASRLKRNEVKLKTFKKGRKPKAWKRKKVLSRADKVKILLAWEHGDLTEGQAAKALRVDRLDARQMSWDAIEEGNKLAR